MSFHHVNSLIKGTSIEDAAAMYAEAERKNAESKGNGIARIAGIAEPPQLLRRPVPDAQPYPFDLLGPTIGNAARAVSETEQIPDAIAANALLSGAAHAAQQHYDVDLHFGVKPCSLFFITVAESGDRKSRADQVARRAAENWQREQAAKYEQAAQEYDDAQTVFKAAKSEALKRKGQDAKAEALKELEKPGPKPRQAITFSGDSTHDGNVKLLGHCFPSLLAGSDEGGEKFGGHSMTAENKRRTIAGECKLWDVGRIDRVRAGDGAESFYGRRLSAHNMMQPVIADDVLGDEVLQGQGILARCLIAAPTSLAGKRKFSTASADNHPSVIAYQNSLAGLWKRGANIDESGGLITQPLALSSGALDLFAEFSESSERRLIPGGPLSQVKPFASKAPEHAARIACVMTAIEGGNPNEIGGAAMRNAIGLMEWYLAEAVRLCGEGKVSPEIRLAEQLLKWLRDNQVYKFYPVLLYQKGPKAIRERKHAKAAIKTLDEHGYLTSLTADGKRALLDGKPRYEAWELVEAAR